MFSAPDLQRIILALRAQLRYTVGSTMRQLKFREQTKDHV